MAYSSVSQIRVATGFSDSSKISDATISSYIQKADGLINAKVVDAYTIPFKINGVTQSTAPPLIEELSILITSALLYRNEYGEESQGTDKGWKDKLDWAMDVLEQISKLEIKLLNDSGVEYDRTTRLQVAFYPDTNASKEGEDAEKFFKMRQDF